MLVLLALQSQLRGADCTVLREARVGGVLDATLLSPDGVLTGEIARACFQQYSSGLSARPSWLTVKILGERSDATLARTLTDICYTFSECRDALRTALRPRGPVVEVLQSASGALMRYRSEVGEVYRSVLYGSDPSRLRFGSSHFKVLFLEVSAPTPLFRSRPDEGRWVSFYLQSEDPLNESDCSGLTVQLSKELDAPWTMTAVRSDPFFMNVLLYPFTLLFMESRPLPSELAFAKSEEIFCSTEYGKLSCITLVGEEIR